MADDFFAGTARPVVVPAYAPVPVPEPRRGLRRALLALPLLAALAVAGTAAALSAAQPPGQVLAVERDATAAEGWGPIYVDEQGRPGRWDPCTPVRYVVQPGWAPQHGRRDLAEALARITAASGLRFVDEGDTDELPAQDRPAYQPERYGERWAPLLVAWVPPGTTDVGVGGGTQGVSLAVAVANEGGPSLVTGQVVLDAGNRLASGFGPGTTDGEVLLHELAHAVGLGHVLDATQVMYPQTTNSESQFGAGDRRGLTALGAAAGCHPAPAARPLQLG